ncbi:protein kinase [Adoxophyes orana nucleopolyhedrovirus]|uniref:protein kinase n=1 Tax=Adoxophyes orana nucleopolyhedrovirus TaxID=542343 RepID=UPI0001829BD6|nr:protein kinase [Adoxophyes orana nucleopolyhedrovirus]ACF05297.1 protein kinase [Adoxophyes orana nucleopolyhedrovirus]
MVDYVADELTNFKKDTIKMNIKISDGKFGKITVLQHKPTMKLFLCKEIRPQDYNGIEPMVHTIMQKNKYFLKLYYLCETPRRNILIMDYVPDGDLFNLLRKEDHLGEDEVIFIIRQVCEALAALHKHLIIHNDIKLENVLYTRGKQIYLCDYGLCRIKDSKCVDDGTLDYFSPEKLSCLFYSYSVDWWAVGVLTYELLCGIHPYKKTVGEELSFSQLHYRQKHWEITFKKRLSTKAKSFIIGMLCYKKDFRITKEKEILGHEFLV